MRILWLAILISLELLSASIDFSEEEKLWMEQNRVVTYVGDPDWLPFEAFDDKGNYVGIVADLLKHIEKITPLKFKIMRTSSWQDSIETMKSKQVMMMSQSKDYNTQTTELLSEIYYKNPIVIVMNHKQRYVSSLYNIKDKKIAISSTEGFFKKIKEKYPAIKFVEVKSIKEGLQSVVFGKSDAFVNTLAQTSYAIAKRQLNDLRIVGRTDMYTELGFGISSEHPLLKSIMNKALNNIDPNIQNDILSKWIQQKYVEKPDYTAFFVALGVFFVIAVIVLILYIKVQKETEAKIHAQYKMLEQQSKMASMGEMLDAVAHQWKQPLNAISMYLDLMKEDFDDGIVDRAYIDEMQKATHSQITHMTTTLSEFRNFFRPNADVVEFNLLQNIESVLLLTKDEFLKNDINIEVDVDANITIKGNENEFKHLVLNIINNSKDAFNENDVKNRSIFIRATKNEEAVSMEIEDSAGGIPENVIKRIFEANFTTKSASKGTGIGLYMSSQIVEKMGGKLSVENINNGACFFINFSIS
ncbi:signal transduction histidine kinase, solute sensing [Sulfurimonas gotlandica GD1]|uniref:histidine kinase n=1 Tax=Sulfurimonas gotlandica (strain DSM 19862 / JCM 16533 / GD1) TaxID=929558 RepID=B6BH20_SULGG|nr:transporter substrate-binding domain-containing protein [Sulfurimonas gotlandica]EDZ63712.1 sensor kinase of two-component regulatory system [Sulfurimonas gotlandica GD1]EHP29806.1 signal transduction histidine kinase, solute sensing [Sulfurimonas gotlandica GD1]